MIAYKKLKLITKVLNEGWTPNWNNNNERKWYCWFYMDKPGFRLGAADYADDVTYVGSRLCYRTRKLAEYAAKQFIDLYRDLMVIP